MENHPIVSLVKLSVHSTLQGKLHAMACSQAFDAMDDPGAVLFRRQHFTVQLPAVFLVYAGHTDDTPHLPLACHVAQEHREELVDVEPIGLRPTLAPIDLNAGGIDDMVLDPMRCDVAV